MKTNIFILRTSPIFSTIYISNRSLVLGAQIMNDFIFIPTNLVSIDSPNIPWVFIIGESYKNET